MLLTLLVIIPKLNYITIKFKIKKLLIYENKDKNNSFLHTDCHSNFYLLVNVNISYL